MWSRSTWSNERGLANDRPSTPNVIPSAISGTAHADRFGGRGDDRPPRSPPSWFAAWMSTSQTGDAVRAAVASGTRDVSGIVDIGPDSAPGRSRRWRRPTGVSSPRIATTAPVAPNAARPSLTTRLATPSRVDFAGELAGHPLEPLEPVGRGLGRPCVPPARRHGPAAFEIASATRRARSDVTSMSSAV